MRIVFLDIDGVLVNRRSLKERSGRHAIADQACVAALNCITLFGDASIVLSSSWRFCGIEEMRLILRHWKVRGNLIGATPDLTRKPAETGARYVGVPRGREIQAWIDQNGAPESFVILDDEGDMEELAPRLVRTQFEVGLTNEDADRAIQMLSGEPSV